MQYLLGKEWDYNKADAFWRSWMGTEGPSSIAVEQLSDLG